MNDNTENYYWMPTSINEMKIHILSGGSEHQREAKVKPNFLTMNKNQRASEFS